jgi:hypothetical protein
VDVHTKSLGVMINIGNEDLRVYSLEMTYLLDIATKVMGTTCNQCFIIL